MDPRGTMKSPLHILHLEDNRYDADLIRATLEDDKLKCEIQVVQDAESFRAALERGGIDVIISDYSLPTFDGGNALRIARSISPHIPFLFVSGTLGEEVAIEALKNGATDYVLKGSLSRLGPAIRRAFAEMKEQRARKASESRYQSLVRATTQVVWNTNAAGEIVGPLPSWQALTGQSADEIIGHGWIHAIHPADKLETLAAWKQAIQAGLVFEHEYRARRHDGSYRNILSRGVPVLDSTGQIHEWVGTCTDITERKRAERRIAAFSNLGQELSSAKTAKEAANIIVAVADELLGWDAATLDLYSAAKDRIYSILNRDTVSGFRIDCVADHHDVPPTPRARQVMEIGAQLILRDETSSPSADTIPFGDRHRLSASLMYVPIRDGSKVIGILSIQSYMERAYSRADLDTLQSLANHCGGALERIRAEEARTQIAHRMESILQSTGEGIFGIDLEERFTFINRAGSEMLHCPPEQAIGQSIRTWLKLHRNNGFPYANEDCPIRRLLKTGEQLPMSTGIFETHTGQSFAVEYSCYPIFQGKALEGAVIAFTNIAERLSLEAQLRQSQKMEAFGQLAGGVAHDFNNLLTVIRCNIDMLLSDERVPDDDLEALRDVVQASEAAAQLTRQLLAFSRKQALQMQIINLNDAVTNLLKMLRRVIGEDIRLRWELAASPPWIDADTGMIEQVMLNLAVNARDAMPKGGELHIRTEIIECTEDFLKDHSEARVGMFVSLGVRDTGCGIPSDILPRIFEPFFTTKDVGKGTGLGLATVYGIVKQHHGWAEVTSEVGVGTQFTIYLPFVQSSSEVAPVITSVANSRGGTERIMVVEDEPSLRGLARTILQRKGYTVIEASSGLEALAVWKEHDGEVDLLLTDMVMPDGLTGRELAEELRRHRPNLPVIFTSGYSTEFADANFVVPDNGYFLPKPFEPKKLTQIVRECLDKASTKKPPLV